MKAVDRPGEELELFGELGNFLRRVLVVGLGINRAMFCRVIGRDQKVMSSVAPVFLNHETVGNVVSSLGCGTQDILHQRVELGF